MQPLVRTVTVDFMEWHPGLVNRRWWRADVLNDLSALSEELTEVPTSDRFTANLVSSSCTDGSHAPVIDLDHRARLVQSSTPGHSHLYIDENMSWKQYRALLTGFFRCGLIDASVYWRSLDREATYVRPPWTQKTTEEAARGSISASCDQREAQRVLRRIRWRVIRKWPSWWLQDALRRARG